MKLIDQCDFLRGVSIAILNLPEGNILHCLLVTLRKITNFGTSTINVDPFGWLRISEGVTLHGWSTSMLPLIPGSNRLPGSVAA